MLAAVQVFSNGAGERNLHSHDAFDGLWFVLAGRVRIYGAKDDVIGGGPP